MHNLLTILIKVLFSRLGYLISCSLKFVMKVSECRTGKAVVSNGPNILKQENCYIIRLEVSVLQICASMYTWIIKISQLISKRRDA
jgi:lysophospholipid acyltransferase (LPLAT)-like uncharacterized protein